jgi:voltage-gated potassium channel
MDQRLLTTASGRASLKAWLSHLYEGTSARAARFRYRLFFLDLTIILFVIGTSFMTRQSWIVAIDVLCGILVALDFGARLWISKNRLADMRHWSFWVDLLALVSFLAPLGSEGAGFMRILRTLRLLHSYSMLHRLRQDSAYFRRNEEIVLAATHMGVFLFVMTAVVYETQHRTNKHITNYADSLYFTVTALTTTGFGDITLEGTTGRMLSVLIMLFGVTLFLRLAQVMFRPSKVRFQCPSCGLQRHEHDAVHCKACGVVLAIPDDND